MRMTEQHFGTGSLAWRDSSHGLANAATMTAKASDFDKTKHFPDGYLPSGTPVDITDRRAVKPWADKAGATLGFILFDQPINDGDAIAVPVDTHGRVRTHRVPGTFAKPTTAPQPQFVFNEGTDA